MSTSTVLFSSDQLLQFRLRHLYFIETLLRLRVCAFITSIDFLSDGRIAVILSVATADKTTTPAPAAMKEKRNKSEMNPWDDVRWRRPSDVKAVGSRSDPAIEAVRTVRTFISPKCVVKLQYFSMCARCNGTHPVISSEKSNGCVTIRNRLLCTSCWPTAT